MDWNDRIRAAWTTAANSPDEDVVEELAQHARATYEMARADGCSHAEADQRVTVQIAAWSDDRAGARHVRKDVPYGTLFRPSVSSIDTPQGSTIDNDMMLFMSLFRPYFFVRVMPLLSSCLANASRFFTSKPT